VSEVSEKNLLLSHVPPFLYIYILTSYKYIYIEGDRQTGQTVNYIKENKKKMNEPHSVYDIHSSENLFSCLCFP